MQLIENTLYSFIHAINAPEIKYSALVFILFIFPRFLIRWGIPYALSAFSMGVLASFLGIDISKNEVVTLLAFLGIISLFLFAGLEIDFDELKQNQKILVQHILIRFGLLAISAFGFVNLLHLNLRQSLLLGLAVLTPSVGFILDTLDQSTLAKDRKYWIRTKAISAELAALILMFVLIRSLSIVQFIFSALAMTALVLVLPMVFRFFAQKVDPVAPKSEFGFLIIMALFSGMITKKLGAYYLIGAFVVGLVARKFEISLPGFTSKTTMRSLKFFSNFFVPFYFFHAGLKLESSDFSLAALGVGLGLLVVFIPIRMYSVLIHHRYVLHEDQKQSMPIATMLLPNLVFGLVLSEILLDSFHIPRVIFGGLIVYSVGVTLLPNFMMKYFTKYQEDTVASSSDRV